MEWVNLVLDVLAIVGTSSVVAATPVAKYLAYVPTVKKVVNFLAMNIGNAKNANDTKEVKSVKLVETVETVVNHKVDSIMTKEQLLAKAKLASKLAATKSSNKTN